MKKILGKSIWLIAIIAAVITVLTTYVKDKVVVCSKNAVFQATILEINDGSYLVEPEEDSPELNSADRIEINSFLRID